MKRSAVPAIGLAVAFALAGCAQQSDFTDESGKTQQAGLFQYERDGGTMTLQVPADPQEYADTVELESLRKDAKAPEVTYIVGDADNTKGTSKLSPAAIYLHDKDGKEFEFDAAAGYLAENWDPKETGEQAYSYPDGSPMDEATYDAVGTRVQQLYDSHAKRGAPGTRSTQVWIHRGTDVPDKFKDLRVLEDENRKDDVIKPTRAAGEALPDAVKRAR